MRKQKDKRIYLDYAAATPLDPEVAQVISTYQKNLFANPSAIYSSGVEARKKVEEARVTIAHLIKAHSDEIIFTGSGTESDALAVIGAVNKYKLDNPKGPLPHIITSEIEHPAVLENCKLLEERNEIEITYISPNEMGLIDPRDIRKVIKDNTILISIMYANNEIGTVEPIEQIAKIVRQFKKQKGNRNLYFPLLHTDACQAINYLPIKNIEKLGVDMMSFNSSKIYGPKGIGALYKKRNVKLSPIYKGGGQELGLRSGTENVAYILGFSKALEKTSEMKNMEVERLTGIRDYAIDKLLKISVTPFEITLNGDRKNRLPNNINISIRGISSELLVVELSSIGIEVSEKSSCHSSDSNGSYVIKAIKKSYNQIEEQVQGSLRISTGRGTTKKDIDKLISGLETILGKYQSWK